MTSFWNPDTLYQPIQPPQEQHNGPHRRRSFNIARRSSKHEPQPHRKLSHSISLPQHERTHAQHHAFHLHLAPLDLKAVAMKLFAPTTFLQCAPHAGERCEEKDVRQAQGDHGNPIAHVDPIQAADEKDGEFGPPLCREAEIEKWNTDKAAAGQRRGSY